MPTADPHPSAEERAQLLQALDKSHREFFAALDAVSDAKWSWKPAPNQWSVGETAHHIVLAESLLFRTVCKAVATPPNPDWEEQTGGKTEFLFRVLPARQRKAVAPDPIVPRDLPTPAQVKEQFVRQRVEIVKFAAESQEPLKQHTIVHPFPIFGTLNAYQWLLYVPLHTMRHHRQIAEVKAAPGYPSD